MPKKPRPVITAANVEQELSALELRHKAHQAMLDSHIQRKATARERHHRRWHLTSIPPICLI